MSSVYSFGDDAATTFAEDLDELEQVQQDGVTADEEPRLAAVTASLRQLQPDVENMAVTLRANAQLSRVGVTRFPLAPLRREIASLHAYKLSRAGIKNISSFAARKRRVKASTSDAA
jgi:hypothetical protein